MYLVARGHFDDEGQALQWLEKAYEERDGGLSLLKVNPGLDGFRAEPRFAAILKHIGLS